MMDWYALYALMWRPRRANSLARMLPGVATPWPAAPPMPTAKSMWGIALGLRLELTSGTAERVRRRMRSVRTLLGGPRGVNPRGRPEQPRDQSAAMQSISTRAPLGSAPTWTVARAGGALWKYRPYASLTLAKSAMSATKIVVFTTFSKLAPPASSTAFRFSITRSVCAPTSPCTGLPVAGSIGSCPDTNRKDPGLTPIPWLEESVALGA